MKNILYAHTIRLKKKKDIEILFVLILYDCSKDEISIFALISTYSECYIDWIIVPCKRKAY